MAMSKARKLARRIAAKWRRRGNPGLVRSLAHVSNGEIDIALAHAGLERADLYTPKNAIARHRIRMAHMLGAVEIHALRAVRNHWEALKRADGEPAPVVPRLAAAPDGCNGDRVMMRRRFSARTRHYLHPSPVTRRGSARESL